MSALLAPLAQQLHYPCLLRSEVPVLNYSVPLTLMLILPGRVRQILPDPAEFKQVWTA